MSKKTGLYFFCTLLILSILSASFASAITGSIGNARMILKAEVGETLQKYILVKNVNNISLSINLSVSGDLEKYVSILDNNFVLQPGEKKKAYFTIKAKKSGTYETNINVLFTSKEEKNGIGLSSTIVLVAYAKGFNPALLLIVTPVLLIILLILLARRTSKKRKKKENNLKLNSKKEMRHR